MSASVQQQVLPVSLVRSYYMLAKPGIIYGNCISAAAGFLVAVPSFAAVDWRLLLATLAGTALIIGGACVLNNIIDRRIDAKMHRTRQRALVSHAISLPAALVYGILLCILGFATLAAFTNLLTVYVGIGGLYAYVLLYSVAKRRSTLGTPLGSIAGSMPILAGYTAMTNRLDLTAGLLFAAMALWQMPHFFAIAMYRLEDYKAAGLPVLPAVKGNARTKLYMVLYIVAFIGSAAALTLTNATGVTFLVGMVAAGAWWLQRAIRAHRTTSDAAWARSMFKASLIVLLTFSALLSLNSLVP